MLKSHHKVKLHFPNTSISIRERGKLKQFLLFLFKMEKINLDTLDYVFCSDSYLLDINQRFLGKDDYTDTVSFLLSEKTEPVIGEVYISLERIRDNASIFKVSIKEETLRVIFHGALHLCGYEDQTQQQIIQMRSKENHYLMIYLRRKGSTNHSFPRKH